MQNVNVKELIGNSLTIQADKSLVDMHLWREDAIPDVNRLFATIIGPADSPYEGGLLKSHSQPPVIKFSQKLANGVPLYELTTALVAIQAILSDPELSEAQDLVVARQIAI
ncbi:ubiquitin-conjugating enzyme E2 27-like protein [Tanacetum coccineum]